MRCRAVPESWHSSPIISSMAVTIVACSSDRPSSRSRACRIRERTSSPNRVCGFSREVTARCSPVRRSSNTPTKVVVPRSNAAAKPSLAVSPRSKSSNRPSAGGARFVSGRLPVGLLADRHVCPTVIGADEHGGAAEVASRSAAVPAASPVRSPAAPRPAPFQPDCVGKVIAANGRGKLNILFPHGRLARPAEPLRGID